MANTKDTAKSGETVEQFSKQIGRTADRLLEQFKDAGIQLASINDFVTEDQKQKLLRYLKQLHGGKQEASPAKIALRRAKTSEIKLGGSHGAGKTVSIQVRKKRTFVKRDEEIKAQSEEAAAPVEAATVAPAVLEIPTSLTPAIEAVFY